MGVYGFSYHILIGLVSADGYNNLKTSSYNNGSSYNVLVPNPNAINPFGTLYPGSCLDYPPVNDFPDWLSTSNSAVDLRTVFLKCNSLTTFF